MHRPPPLWRVMVKVVQAQVEELEDGLLEQQGMQQWAGEGTSQSWESAEWSQMRKRMRKTAVGCRVWQTSYPPWIHLERIVEQNNVMLRVFLTCKFFRSSALHFLMSCNSKTHDEKTQLLSLRRGSGAGTAV